MNILAVESSCDETAVAIVRDGREVLTDCIASQVDLAMYMRPLLAGRIAYFVFCFPAHSHSK